MSKYPETTVGAFIRNKQGKILLVKTHKWEKGKLWTVPGGRIELGETIEEAIKREVQEEVGLKIKFQKVFAIFDVINPEKFYIKKHFIFLECDCLLEKNQKVRIDNKEIQEAKWFSFSELANIKIEHFARKAIKKLIQNY